MRVVVLGSGVVGVTSAYYLARAGHEVAVIDREPGPALETSFANAGQISPGYASPWAAQLRLAVTDALKRLLAPSVENDIRGELKLRSDQGGKPLRDHARQHGVTLTASNADLAAQSDFIISAVTASQAVTVAKECAAAVRQGAWFLDFNSASPGAKVAAAGIVTRGGGRYVEGAVMTAVPPHRIKVPLLLGGPDAAQPYHQKEDSHG